ncbi:hypothetical protein ON010_g18453 [Phytophthora cinnamomi]|nr:hypothetical protein ON010_g18453 [Phytophthora cinnamomi]
MISRPVPTDATSSAVSQPLQGAPTSSTAVSSIPTVSTSSYASRAPSWQHRWRQLSPGDQIPVPASLNDILHGVNLAYTPDGLSRLVPVTEFFTAELDRLSALASSDATYDLLRPSTSPLPDLPDPRIRVGFGRKMLLIAHCYGVDQLALRALNTVRYLQLTVRYLNALERQSSGPSSAADIVRLNMDARICHAEQLRAASAGSSALTTSAISDGTEIQKLKAEVPRLRQKGAELKSEKVSLSGALDVAVSDLAAAQAELSANQQHALELTAQVNELRRFRQALLMTSGWTGRTIPAEFRTLIKVSARDQDSNGIGSYVTQAFKSSTAGSQASPSQPDTAQPSSQQTTTSKTQTPPKAIHPPTTGAGKQRRRPLKPLPLAATLAPSSFKSAGCSVSQQAAPSASVTVDLTDSAAISLRAQVKLYIDRIALSRLPSKYRHERRKARDTSLENVVEVDAARNVPSL